METGQSIIYIYIYNIICTPSGVVRIYQSNPSRLIYYNTAVRDLTDIYARLPRVPSALGRVRTYQSNPEQAVL